MKKLSVHTNRKLTPNLKHNDRSTKEKHKNVFGEKTHLNQIDKSAKKAMEEINQLYKEAMKKLEGKKGKRTPKESSYTEMIFEVDENHTLEDCQRLADKICELTGFRRIQVSLHKDEGHYEDDGTFKTHNHAHAVFFTLDKESGKQLARREKGLSDTNLSKLQDLAYEVLRGEVREKGEKKEYLSDYRDYKRLKKREEGLNKREIALNQRENSLNQKESEIQGKELKEQEYKHYQELLELHESKDRKVFYLGLNDDELVKKNLEAFQGLGDDIYKPLESIFYAEFIKKIGEKAGFDMDFTHQYSENGDPEICLRVGRKQRLPTNKEIGDNLKYVTQEDINNFETFQTVAYLASVLKENHKILKEMKLTDFTTPNKLRVSEKMITSIAKLVKESKSLSNYYGK